MPLPRPVTPGISGSNPTSLSFCRIRSQPDTNPAYRGQSGTHGFPTGPKWVQAGSTTNNGALKMEDEPSRAGYEHGQRLDATFLNRALDAVLRLVDIYAAERGIKPNSGLPHPLGLVAYGDPISKIDAPTAASPSGSLTDADAPRTVAASSSEGVSAGDEPSGSLDPNSSRRGGWTKGNSTSANIRAGAVAFLRQKGHPAKGPEITRALLAQGMVIIAKDPIRLVSSRIGRSPLFVHTYAGYGLAEWQKGGGARPNGKG